MHESRHLFLPFAAIVLIGVAFTSADIGAQAITDYPPASPCTLRLQWQADGDSAGEYFGFSVAGGGDWNGDGKPDILVGAMLGDRVDFFYESFGSFSRGWSLPYPSGSDFGRSVVFTGDMNGNGTNECVIGAPGHSSPSWDSCGLASAHGAGAGWQFTLSGQAIGEKLGYSVGSVGDVDGDGIDEIVMGAPEAAGPLGPRTGYAILTSPMWIDPPVYHRFDGTDPYELFGRAVAGAGDVDGDGSPDVIIGAPLATVPGSPVANVGSAFVYRADGSLIWRFNGNGPSDYFGNSVANAGDVNNDGRPDIIVGAWRADHNSMVDAGLAYVYSGMDGSLIHALHGEGPNHNFGYSVSGLGDIDADGHDDFIVGAHRADLDGMTDGGAVYVYSGKYANVLWVITGLHSDDIFGVSTSTAGDMTLDGRPDFLVGAFGTDQALAPDYGSAFLFGCDCNCAFNGDPAHDGVPDVLDVVETVSDAFRGDPNEKSSSCRYCDSDVDCSGACDIIDVVKMVNVAFRGADKATEFCTACQ